MSFVVQYTFFMAAGTILITSLTSEIVLSVMLGISVKSEIIPVVHYHFLTKPGNMVCLYVT